MSKRSLLKLRNMTPLTEISGDGGHKKLWWKQTRHGILVCLKDYGREGAIVTFLEGVRPLRIERSDGGSPVYDLVRRIESFN